MKRFLFKFFFVLFALIAALPAQAKTVFFKNTNNWSTVKAHIWNGTAGTTWPGNEMTNLGDGWYCVETGDCKNIQFNGGSSDKQTGDLTIPTEQTECAYNNGWNNWSGYTLYLSHPWGGGGWGTWIPATNNYDGTFSLVEYYGGDNNNTGCDWGYTASKTGYVTDQNATYVASIPKNTECTFTFDRKTNTLTITKKAATTQLAAPTFSPAGGTFTSAQSVTISQEDGADIYYTTDGSDPTTSSTKYASAITVNETTTIRAIAVKDGYTNSEIAEATYTINSTTPTTYTYALHGQITGDPNMKSTLMTDDDGDGIWSVTDDFVVGEFGIKKMDADYNQVANGWFGWSAIGSPADNCVEGTTTGFIKLTADGNYTISFNTANNTITVKANSTPTPTTGKIYVPVSEYDKTVAYIYSWDANNDNYKLFGNPGAEMAKETVNGVDYWTVTVESSKLPATVTGWILHNGSFGDKASNNNNTDLPGVTFQDGYVYHINGTSEPIIYINAPTFSPEGGEITSAQNVTISAADGATIYYTTDGTDPTTSSTKYESAITVSKTTTIKAIAVKDGHTSSIASATYTLVEPECWYLPGASTSNAVQMTKRADGSFTLTIDIEADATFNFSKKQSTDAAYILGPTSNGDYWLTSEKINTDINLILGNSTKFIMKNGAGSYTITVSADYKTVRFVKSTAQAGDIPVYPTGVNSEAELNAYDFEANPVYYLLADVLNDNRVTPEWQLTKGAGGLYHLNGFAMRNTGAVKVRQYTSAGTYVDHDSKAFTTALNTSEGQLYNATFDPNGNSLSLTPASGTKMPFISLVGYMMQQDQVYDTPRGVEKTPEGTKSSKGWQEAWLLYDANGKLLKDRKGNVMYSTMWPPKNPVYFTATIGSNQRLYSSDQMTFVPVQEGGNNVGKTGAEWEAELKALDAEAYDKLNLDDSKTYYRYVVSDIWYVGAGKIWTGWGGETVTTSDNKQIANWSKHKNWGYEDKNANDTDGTPINAQTTYNVVKDKGNFLFENPTYFKTFEFFYETGDPNANSQIYTTLAYGSASIAAQNVKEGDSYTKGSYQAKVSLPEGVTISSWTITRHDATTNKLAPIGSDNGEVATGDGTNFPTEFTNDKGGLGEGRYYYELTVTFSNTATSTERTSTVRSNPFVIYYPNQYSVDANGYQLVKLDTDKAIDGYSYVTYNAKANGDLYFVNLTTDNKVANFRVATSAERETVNGYFAANSGIKWTDKVFVYAPVPAEFKVDAEKDNATVSFDQIVSYDVNATKGVSPVNHELAVVDNKGNFANKAYKAVMNYKEKDIASTETEKWSDKTSLGKENLTVMQMPNVVGGEVKVTVESTTNSDNLDINYNGTTKSATPAKYYNVSVELPFSDPKVEAANAPQYEVKVTDANDVTTTKVYTSSGTGDRALTFTNVNPLDFAGKSIEVNAKYFDGEGYNLYANLGESAKLESGTAKFTGCTPKINALDAIASKAPKTDEKGNVIQKDVIVVTELKVSHDGIDDNIGGKAVDAGNALYNADFYLQDAVAHNGVYILDELNFTAEFKPATDENKHNVWTGGAIIFDNNTGVTEKPNLKVEITPFYVAKVTNTEGTVGLTTPNVSSAPADPTYVALTCETVYKQGLQLATSVTDITESANVKAYKVIENGEIYIIYGDRKFNVMGAEVK